MQDAYRLVVLSRETPTVLDNVAPEHLEDTISDLVDEDNGMVVLEIHPTIRLTLD